MGEPPPFGPQTSILNLSSALCGPQGKIIENPCDTPSWQGPHSQFRGRFKGSTPGGAPQPPYHLHKWECPFPLIFSETGTGCLYCHDCVGTHAPPLFFLKSVCAPPLKIPGSTLGLAVSCRTGTRQCLCMHWAPGDHLYFRPDIILVKRLSKYTLNMYFSGMKIGPKYTFLLAFFLICPSCPFQICQYDQKHTLSSNFAHFFTPKRCKRVHCLVLKNNPNYVIFFFLWGWYPTLNTSAPPPRHWAHAWNNMAYY